MSCNSGPLNRRDFVTEIEDKAPAILCGLFTVLERQAGLKAMLGEIDWREAGVARDWVERWWKQHKKEDAARRKREKAERKARDRQRALAEAARKKLTRDELDALRQDDREDS